MLFCVVSVTEAVSVAVTVLCCGMLWYAVLWLCCAVSVSVTEAVSVSVLWLSLWLSVTMAALWLWLWL